MSNQYENLCIFFIEYGCKLYVTKDNEYLTIFFIFLQKKLYKKKIM